MDLNSLIPGPPFSPLFLLQAFGINDRGEITGEGVTSDGELHGFLAVPCDDNHASQTACQENGLVSSADVSTRSSVGAETAATARSNPAFSVSFRGLRDGPPIQQVRPPLIRGNVFAK